MVYLLALGFSKSGMSDFFLCFHMHIHIFYKHALVLKLKYKLLKFTF